MATRPTKKEKQGAERGRMLEVPVEQHERIRELADVNGRKIKAVTAEVITKGLEVIEHEQHQPQHATDRT